MTSHENKELEVYVPFIKGEHGLKGEQRTKRKTFIFCFIFL